MLNSTRDVVLEPRIRDSRILVFTELARGVPLPLTLKDVSEAVVSSQVR